MTEVMSRSTKDWVSVAPLALLFLASDAGASPSAAAPPLQLQSVADVPLGGHPTRLDYASLDVGRHPASLHTRIRARAVIKGAGKTTSSGYSFS